MCSNMFHPHILLPTRIVDNARPCLLDTIFTNTLDQDIFCGNILDKISDHLPNFIVLNNSKQLHPKTKITKRDYSNFIEQDFLSDLDNNRITELMIESADTNEKYDIFHRHMHAILDKHAPLKPLSRKKKNNYISHG